MKFNNQITQIAPGTCLYVCTKTMHLSVNILASQKKVKHLNGLSLSKREEGLLQINKINRDYL